MLISCVGMAAGAADTVPVITPPALHWGDTIAIVAPAGDLDRTRIDLARKRLTDMGFNVRIPDDLFRRRGYLAGKDEERAAELMAAFRDPAVNAIFCGTGGYGTTRMLDRLDYDAIRRNPKILTGFSDITALHLAIQRKSRLVTFHSPVAMYGLGSPDNMSSFTAEYFWRSLLASNYLGADSRILPAGFLYAIPEGVPAPRRLAPGTVRGPLTGGNLSLISTLMGTPYEIETRGRVLFLEDCNEEPYRIDRYLSQLRLAGKLDEVAGVVLGMFAGCNPKSPATSLSLEEVFRDYFAELGVPVITNFPVGHFRHNATLPMSIPCELNADAPGLRILENPVRIESNSEGR